MSPTQPTKDPVPVTILVTGLSTQANIDALHTIWDQPGTPPVWMGSIDYLIRRAQINILTSGLPGIVMQIQADWQDAIRKENANSPAPPPDPTPVLVEQAKWNAANHAMAWIFPNFVNAIKAWYDTYGTQHQGTKNIGAVPDLPKELMVYLVAIQTGQKI